MVELRRRGAEVPTKKIPGAACYDLKSLDNHIIPPKGKAFFDIGLAFKMEIGWTVQIHNRSGLSLIENIVNPKKLSTAITVEMSKFAWKTEMQMTVTQ